MDVKRIFAAYHRKPGLGSAYLGLRCLADASRSVSKDAGE